MSTHSDTDLWFGHPRPLALLFSIEMWERFGFYGMRALLMLYLTKHFVLGDHAAAGIYGGYSALVYLTPLVGGLVADSVLGSKRSVRFGALLMAVGYFALAFGGSPAQPWVRYDGVRHAINITHFVDRPTSDSAEQRVVSEGGRLLIIKGREDGGIDLLATNGSVARYLAKSDFTEGSDKDPLHLAILLMALSTIAVGSGFFKPNISTMVGALYAQGDQRRDAGFTLFYMGINLGSIIGQFLCPILADTVGWGAGFCAAGVMMLTSFGMVCLDGGRLAGYGEAPAGVRGKLAPWVYGGAILSIPLFYLLFVNLMQAGEPAPGSGLLGYLASLPLMGRLLTGAFALGVPAILGWSWRKGSRQEFQMMLAAMILITFNTVFWSLFEQAGSSLTLFADRNTDRSVFGLFTLSAPQIQNFNPVAIVVLAPVLGALWVWLARRGLQPSIPVKFGVALVLVGAGFWLLVLGRDFAGADYKVGLGWLFGLYLLHSVAELCISPVGLSMITKLAITRVIGLMMGVWFLSVAMGEYVAGMVAQWASVATVAGQVTNRKMSLDTYVGVFSHIGVLSMVIGLVLLVLAGSIKRLMYGVD